MHGHGNFSDPRLGVNIVQEPDLVTPKLAALRAYQHSIGVPPTPGASYNRGAARRGKIVFDANCASCHLAGNLTDNNNGVLHAPSETGMDSTYATRTRGAAPGLDRHSGWSIHSQWKSSRWRGRRMAWLGDDRGEHAYAAARFADRRRV